MTDPILSERHFWFDVCKQHSNVTSKALCTKEYLSGLLCKIKNTFLMWIHNHPLVGRYGLACGKFFFTETEQSFSDSRNNDNCWIYWLKSLLSPFLRYFLFFIIDTVIVVLLMDRRLGWGLCLWLCFQQRPSLGSSPSHRPSSYKTGRHWGEESELEPLLLELALGPKLLHSENKPRFKF